jgi:hypothetical protein
MKWTDEGVDRHYNASHVNHLARCVIGNADDVPVRVVCVTDDPTGISCETFPLWEDCGKLRNASGAHLPSCYRRLKIYDRATQRELGIPVADRVVSIDLDSLVTGNLRDVLLKKGIFVGWKLAGMNHDETYNGSFQMFTAGSLRDIWEDFDPARSPQVASAAGWRGSDQAWLSMKLIGREGCTNIDYPTFASYPLHIRKMGAFSARTRLVFFHGKKKPWSPEARAEASWISRYWRDENALPK